MLTVKPSLVELAQSLEALRAADKSPTTEHSDAAYLRLCAEVTTAIAVEKIPMPA